ncbi:YkgJ family cysteine cluster protein [Fulvivirga lutea]|uniref:YkgJ family cysteine cluster protein n=1 Tax=Fulvivirga lutea TaxID=2810512 RepID=A0A975A1B2_9BACT|nr:YkgJ family cysteine cluster protein [Fulvivirga lutea]QSE98259.1 YkgJ family cysteine cluster protein [Fulvivirga lutea]
MSIYLKVKAVERVFNSLEKDIKSFQQSTGLGCVSGCGLCCHKPNITATALEFLPFAYELYKQNLAYQWLDDLQTNKSGFCRILNPMPVEGSKGFCGHYQYRGLICRAFGFAAMKNKLGQPTLVTCKTIKTEFPESYERASNHVSSGKNVPLMSNYYHQLRSIDSDLGRELIPINDAILSAVKVVLGHYAYRKPYRRRA